jgi:hypothetical protein
MRDANTTLVESLKERDLSENLGIDGRIKLEKTLRK